MTIVVWDGKTLAADRMTTRTSASKAGAAKEHRTSESTKLIIFPNQPRFGKDRLLACGYSGSVEQFAQFHVKVFGDLKKPDLDPDVDFYDRVEIMSELQLGIPEMSALFLTQTEKGVCIVHTLEWVHRNRQSWRATVHFTRHGLHQPCVAIGSGRQSTNVFAKALELTSAQYVHLATKYASACGNGMDLFQPGWDKLKRQQDISEQEKKDIAELFAKSL